MTRKKKSFRPLIYLYILTIYTEKANNYEKFSKKYEEKVLIGTQNQETIKMVGFTAGGEISMSRLFPQI